MWLYLYGQTVLCALKKAVMQFTYLIDDSHSKQRYLQDQMSSIGSCEVPICMCSVPVQKLGTKVQVPVLVQAKTRNDKVEVFFITVTNCFWYFCGRRWDKESTVNEGLPQAQISVSQFCTGTAAVHRYTGITYGCWLCCGCTAHSQQDLESLYFSPGLPACWQDCSLFSNARWTTYVNWFFW